jgi:hypothetical protein
MEAWTQRIQMELLGVSGGKREDEAEKQSEEQSWWRNDGGRNRAEIKARM